MSKQKQQNTNSTDNNRPTHDLLAVIDNGEDQKATFVELCALWPTREGNGLNGTIVCDPLGWADRRVPRRILVRKREV